MHRLIVSSRCLRIVAPLMLALFAAEAFSFRGVADTPATKEMANSLGMKFTSIAAGEFLMGASEEEIAERKKQLLNESANGEDARPLLKDDLACVETEGPQHRVTISKPFWLGTYEVTQEEFQAVMGFNPSAHAATGSRAKQMAGLDTRRHPVEKVSWDDAAEFCKQLSNLDEEVAAGRSYRLPTEAEWEYAYRAGTTTKYFWGDEGGRKFHDWTKYPKIGAGKKMTTVPVGGLKPNPWGLYDMTGNAREWCADWYDAKTYTRDAARDPTGPMSGTYRVMRGGMSYLFLPAQRSAARHKRASEAADPFSGVRVVCELRAVAPVAAATALIAAYETKLKEKGLIRQGTFFVLADEAAFARFTATLERMRAACFMAQREVDNAKQQLKQVSAAKAATLEARTNARTAISYSDTWREHRLGVLARKNATDTMAIVDLSREGVESWLADAQTDFDNAVSQFAVQCKTLREMHQQLQAKQQQVADDSAVKSAIAAVSSAGKTKYRLGPGPNVSLSLKKLEHEEVVLRQLKGG